MKLHTYLGAVLVLALGGLVACTQAENSSEDTPAAEDHMDHDASEMNEMAHEAMDNEVTLAISGMT